MYVTLSSRMIFNILVVYNPPSSCLQTFYQNLEKILKSFKPNREMLIYGDTNVNWLNKSSRKQLKELTSKYDFHQFVKGPTRLTKTSQTAIDLAFSNKPDRVLKTYNLVCGLSDHNMILISRKLSRNRLNEYKNEQKVTKLIIPRRDLIKVENE